MKRRLSVLHVAQPTEGGVARSVSLLVADQVASGWRVAVACPVAGDLASAARAAGARHDVWHATRSPGTAVVAETVRLGRVLRDVKPDLVHLHSSKAGLVGRLALRGRLPTIFQPRAWSFYVGGTVAAAALRWERLAARYCDAVVCVSERERELGEEAGIRARFVVVPNGVDLDALPEATEQDRHNARGSLGLPDGRLVVCVGRLSHQKGQDLLLDAWPAVTVRASGARLVLVGGGPDRQKLLARGVDGVALVGPRDDVPDWLAAADVVALPSRWEGMALTLLEAMSRGRSVVATDVAGTREALANGGGAVVPVGDVAALAAAVVERLLHPELAAEEGRAGRTSAERHHDVRRTAAAIRDVYEDVLERRAKRAAARS